MIDAIDYVKDPILFRCEDGPWAHLNIELPDDEATMVFVLQRAGAPWRGRYVTARDERRLSSQQGTRRSCRWQGIPLQVSA